MLKSLADMARSLGLMAIVIAAMLFIGARYLIFPGSSDRMPAADYSDVLQGFGEVAKVAPLAPHSLPSSWRANATRLTSPATGVEQLHVGWAIPGSRFAGLDESDGAIGSVVSSVLGASGAKVRGTTDISGATWDVRTSDRHETAYTRSAGRVFIVVTGNATDTELRLLAGSLH